MLRFLKWIFLVFGTLAFSVMIFFYQQNKSDISYVWDIKSHLSYESMKNTCVEVEDDYLFPCFKPQFEKALSDLGLTGISIVLKLAFNFIDEDKANQKKFYDKEKEVVYALNYLELNNIAIKYSTNKFTGFEFMYGGYLSSVRDFLDNAQSFSQGLIDGLSSEEGIVLIDEVSKHMYFQDLLSKLESEFNDLLKEAKAINQSKIDDFLQQSESN